MSPMVYKVSIFRHKKQTPDDELWVLASVGLCECRILVPETGWKSREVLGRMQSKLVGLIQINYTTLSLKK